MSYAIPVIDLGRGDQLDAVRAGSEQFGAVQVVNHGVPRELIEDRNGRVARLLARPRAEKARLASPHPYRGWRQWPDRVADHLAEYGRPEQIAAWRDGTPYVAELAPDSAGR
jgi:non-haem dioxygenase in morphine synthesis N-terminal